MQFGQKRFSYFLNQLEELLNQSKFEKEPVIFLYKNNFRGVCFMLEALAKMYASLHNKKRFGKMKERFKTLEDAFGRLDYYAVFYDQLKSNKKLEGDYLAYIADRQENCVVEINNLLQDEKWLNGKRLAKINSKLNDADWLAQEIETNAIEIYLAKEIEDCKVFMHESLQAFDHIETDLHELRRKLRWLSIYPQALLGSIQLKSDKTVVQAFKKYATKKVVDSPFCKFPNLLKSKRNIFYYAPAFYGLSSIIAELGQLKDQGLLEVLLNEATLVVAANKRQTKQSNPIQTIKGNTYQSPEKILNAARKIIEQFISDACLDSLLVN